MKYELTVGMEIHIELETATKMFCGCPNDPFHSKPNTNVCPVCYGLPGALPLLNKKAIELVVQLGQALKADVASETFWARKNYFYPDLPKGYQISQSTKPLIQGGVLTIDGETHRIEHAHLEEDAGKLTHDPSGESLVDYNRAGVPLLELVTHPDFHSAEAAKRFCQELQRIVRSLKISSADMEKGQMRCEANISISAEAGKLGTKVEVKNINSFRSVEKAISYEFDRQMAALEAGEAIVAETRTWNDADNQTVPMRTKETSADYRYFPEPDLPVVTIDYQGSDTAHQLPDEQRQSLMELGLAPDTARLIVDRGLTATFLPLGPDAGELAKIYLAKPTVLELDPADYGAIIELKRTHNPTKDQLAELIDLALKTGKKVSQVAGEVFGGVAELGPLITAVLAEQPQAVADYAAGKANTLNFLVGQVMAKAQGRANIVQVRDELQKKLAA